MKIKKKMCGLILAVILSVAAFVPANQTEASPMSVEYASVITVTADPIVYDGVKMDRGYCFSMGTCFKNARKVAVTVGNTNIIDDVTWEKKDGFVMFATTGKTGTSDMIFKVWKKNGTKTYRTKIKAVKYKCPIKSLKIGSKEYAGVFKKSDRETITGIPKKKAKITVAPLSGWKVEHISVYYGEYPSRKYKELKNKGTFDFGKNNVTSVAVVLKNKKTGQVIILG